MTKRNPMPGATWDAALTAKERRFVLEYAIDLNATQAAIRAGYGRGNVKSARDYAHQLRRKTHIAEAISALIAERSGLTGALVIDKLAAIANATVADVATVKDGAIVVKDTADLSADTLTAIAGYDVNERGYVTVRLHDRIRALELLSKILGMKRSVNEAPQVAVQVNVSTGAADRVMQRLDALVSRQQALPPPAEQPIDVEFTPIAEKEIAHV